MRSTCGVLALTLSVTTGLAAQEHEHQTSPYADEMDREIKALSADEVRGYLEGDGLGLARVAELNGYPGPRHVLDLADDLGLSRAQTARVRQVFDTMRARAIQLGQQIVEAERELDRAFAGRSIEPAGLERATSRIAQLRGRLRHVHLSAHLLMSDLLDSDQILRYRHLRGYVDGDRP